MKKFILFFLPVVLIALSLGFYYSNGGNTATSIAEALNTSAPIPVVNQQFDMVGAWTSGSVLPSARYYTGGVGHVRNDSGFVYVFGGDSTGAGTAAGVNTYRYNIAANTWTLMAPLPQGRRIMGSAVLGDTVYCIDGLGGFASSMIMYKYNINANTWSTAANAPDSMWYVKSAGYQDSLIYLVGGYGANGVSRTSVFLYNSKTNSWRTATSLPLGRADGAFAIAGDTLVYVGGLNESVAVTGITYRGVINQADRSQITWTTGTTYPGGVRYRWNAATWGNKGIIVAGGATTGFTGSNLTYTYSPGSDTWTPQANIPAIMLAYPSGSVRYASGIWKFVIGGGVTNPTALTGNTFVFTDTLASPPPPASGDSVLVITNDSTLVTNLAIRKADRDTLKKYLPMLISKIRYITKDSNTVLPSLANYGTVILQETGFDMAIARGLSVVQRGVIKTWLATGTPSAKKNLLLIGADMGYNYERTASPYSDSSFSRTYGGFQFKEDNSAPINFNAVISAASGFSDSLTTSATNYWPDGCAPVSGGVTMSRYRQRSASDSVAGITKVGTGTVVVSVFQDPRYYVGSGGAGASDFGFKRVLKNALAFLKTNGGTITSVTPTSTIADKYSLSQNYPNPFNPTTKISFSIPTNGFVTMKIFDVAGKEVMTLVNKSMTVGSYTVDFNGAVLSSGVYFYRLEAGSFVETKKMMLVK